MRKITAEEAKELITQTGQPCVSIYLPTDKSEGNVYNKMKIRLKNLTKSAQAKLQEDWGYSSDETEELLEPLLNLEIDRDFWKSQSLGLAFFISPDNHETYQVPIDFNEQVVVSHNYDLRQMIPAIFEEKEFYLLALSRNKTKLFRCDEENIEQVKVNNLPESFEEVFEERDMEVSLQSTGGQTGEPGSYHGQGSIENDNINDIIQYFRLIDDALLPYLKAKDYQYPLAIMCDEAVYPYYNKVNSYEYLLDDYVKGSPGKLTDDEIFNKAKSVVLPHLHEEKKAAREDYIELLGSDKTSNDVSKIVPDAVMGKVTIILLAEGAEKPGSYNPNNNEIEPGSGDKDDDLYNFAVNNTILNGGTVYMLPPEEMPEDSEIAAIYRY
ncbi:MAG: hypothetical protein ACQEQG_02640 [Bacillota bacterium]